MASFVDVLLRGLMLAGGALALGGVVFALAVLRTAPDTEPDARAARALRLVALGAGAVAVAQLVMTVVALASLLQDFGAAATAPFARTTFALATLARVTLAVTTALLAVSLARQPRGRIAWLALTAAAVLLVASSATISHAMARLEHRALLLAVDVVHQLAAAIWVGGLIHLLATLRESDRVRTAGTVTERARAAGTVSAGTTCTVSAEGDGAGRAPSEPGDPVSGTLTAHGRQMFSGGGGLLTVPTPPSSAAREVARRFSGVALASVATLVTAGGGLSVAYVGDARALLETAYGVMVLTKVVLLGAILALAVANFRLVRGAASRAGDVRLARFVEVEMGLAVTVLFAAASLTSLPPAADVRVDRATLAEVRARFTAMPPRLASPTISDLLQQTNPLAGGPETRLQVEREWSEFNHHWAGIFVLAMGLAAIAHRVGVRLARHWPLLLVGLALFLFVRNDPEVWPLGPIGFWSSLAQPEILQHRAFMTLVMLFGVFEWAVRVGALTPRPWAYVFPMICAVGGGLLLTHSHAVFNLKEAFLMEVTHAPIGVLGAFAGWARWLELRLPEAGPLAGRLWPACLTAVGILLIFYSEG